MNVFLIDVVLVVLGLCMGSFSGAMVWRLRARQLVEDKHEGERVNEKEYKRLLPLSKVTTTTDRSRCLHCGHTLAWYDLLPLVSWIGTRGKCRYCKTDIGWFEPIIELATAVLFVGLYTFWPTMLQTNLQLIDFFLWLIACVFLVILFAYDFRWFLLPNKIVFPLIGVALIVAIAHISASLDIVNTLISSVIAVCILSGLYLCLWFISKGRWIGFGDVKLGLALALLLGDWQLAFIALFTANLIGCLIVIPGMAMGKITRKTHIPFGPLLIAGCILAKLFGTHILSWYFSTLL